MTYVLQEHLLFINIALGQCTLSIFGQNNQFKKHTEEKSLYLYCGYSRVAKCIREIENEVPYITIEFSAPEHAERWDKCREQIPNVLVDISWLQPEFSKHWVFQHEDSLAIRKYQNYRMDK